jgi:hypothetical protein
MTALVAVFLSLAIGGCYTTLKKSEPLTGERYYNDYDYYSNWDYYGYMGPYFYYNGWYNPYFYTYPSYYGYFYRPWYYDPWWWQYNDGRYGGGRSPSEKEIRRGRGRDDGGLPPAPGGSYNPAPQPGGDQGYQAPPPTNPPAGGNAKPSSGDNKDSDKTTRRRR